MVDDGGGVDGGGMCDGSVLSGEAWWWRCCLWYSGVHATDILLGASGGGPFLNQ